MAIHARDLVKKYKDFTAVAGLSFDVRRGECFGFLGPNGAGKTTTMKMIYGSCSVTEGSLTVMGLDVRSDLRAVKTKLGVVAQEDNLDFELSVVENLLVFARYFGIPRRQARERADELLSFFDLTEKCDSKVEHLSGGMKRRLITARSLIGKPELLILDEPTTGLDPAARHLLWEKMRRLKRDGVTQVLTTHYMDEAERLCDRLVLMDHGKIVAEGTPAELIQAHVGKEVVEVATSEVDRMAAAIGGTKLPDMVVCYTDDGDGVIHKARSTGIAFESARLRRASLEDVFLKVTGRRLE
jgi:lipooligosaccharide transport system ATP-binding protein